MHIGKDRQPRDRHLASVAEPGTQQLHQLLSGDAMLSAIHGQHVGDHPLARWAHLLAGLHHPESDNETAASDGDRNKIVHAIDMWTVQHVPQHRYGASIHTETLGSVIDRMAAAYVMAWQALTTLDVCDPRVHASWQHVAEIVCGYQDLATEVEAGQRRLPTWR